MSERFSDDPVLLKLHRTYGTNEALKYLFDEISQLKFKIGELISENAELNDKINYPDSEETKPAKHWKKDDYFKLLSEQFDVLNKKHAITKKDLEMWRSKYFSLMASCTNSQQPISHEITIGSKNDFPHDVDNINLPVT